MVRRRCIMLSARRRGGAAQLYASRYAANRRACKASGRQAPSPQAAVAQNRRSSPKPPPPIMRAPLYPKCLSQVCGIFSPTSIPLPKRARPCVRLTCTLCPLPTHWCVWPPWLAKAPVALRAAVLVAALLARSCAAPLRVPATPLCPALWISAGMPTPHSRNP